MKNKVFEDKDIIKEEVVEEVKEEKKETPKKRPQKYIVQVENLALRVGPGKDFEKIGLAPAGHTLIDEIKNDFGHLADGSGWVSMAYVMKVD